MGVGKVLYTVVIFVFLIVVIIGIVYGCVFMVKYIMTRGDVAKYNKECLEQVAIDNCETENPKLKFNKDHWQVQCNKGQPYYDIHLVDMKRCRE